MESRFTDAAIIGRRTRRHCSRCPTGIFCVVDFPLRRVLAFVSTTLLRIAVLILHYGETLFD